MGEKSDCILEVIQGVAYKHGPEHVFSISGRARTRFSKTGRATHIFGPSLYVPCTPPSQKIPGLMSYAYTTVFSEGIIEKFGVYP